MSNRQLRISSDLIRGGSMTTHILSMTYGPKIEAIKRGEIARTIRRYNPKKPKKVGDGLLIHTWAGKPYRSKWDWRLRTNIEDKTFLYFPDRWNAYPQLLFDGGTDWVETDEIGLSNIALLDGIPQEPTPRLTAELLCRTLRELNGLVELGLMGSTWEIIDWPKGDTGGNG